jgi:transcriptional regulator with XRE-family HTH domain
MSRGPDRPEGYTELRRIVAANMRHERYLRGWRLKDLAERLAPYLGSLSLQTLGLWEKSRVDGGKAFSIEEVYALCRAFDITLSELLTEPVKKDMPVVLFLPGRDTGADLQQVLGTDNAAFAGLDKAYMQGDPRTEDPATENLRQYQKEELAEHRAMNKAVTDKQAERGTDEETTYRQGLLPGAIREGESPDAIGS